MFIYLVIGQTENECDYDFIYFYLLWNKDHLNLLKVIQSD